MEKRTTILSEGAVADLTGCGKSLNRDDSPPQGLKPSLILHDLRGAKAQLYHSAAGFRDFFRSLLEAQWAIGEPAIEIIRVPPAFPPFQILRGYCLCVWLKRFHRPASSLLHLSVPLE